MKFLAGFILFFIIFSCIKNNGDFLKRQTEYSYDDVTVTYIQNSTATTFVKNGKPVSGTVVQQLRNGRKNVWDVDKGLAVKQTMYYENGQMRRMLEMKNGVEHGTFVMYYSDGQKRVEQFYEEGEPVGTWHQWNRDRQLIETIEH